MGDNFLDSLLARLPELQQTLLEHLLVLTLIPVGLAILIAVPLAIFVRERPVLRSAAVAGSGIVQTIPSLAMLAFLLPLFGIGKTPAVVALTLYAILPILQNSLAGLRDLPPDTLEAADGIGFSKWQRLIHVELSFALPVIFSGIRTATVICVGVATLSTFIGAGGLGDFINRGLSLNRMSLLLIGAGSAAVLALILDFVLETAGLLLRPGRKARGLGWKSTLACLLLAGVVAFSLFPFRRGAGSASDARDTVIEVGSKNFTEQILLGELLAQWVEDKTDLGVSRRFNLGGTMICHEALLAGSIDLYVEYSGTSFLTLLGMERPPDATPQSILQRVREEYAQRFDLVVLPPLGFENTYAITVRAEMANERGWKTISDLAKDAPELAGGFTAEFMERSDGLPGLIDAYDLAFRSLNDLAPELMYPAVATGSVDVIGAFSTDARIKEYDLVVLEDDRRFFPPYQAFPVARAATLQKHPELKEALIALSHQLNAERMMELNHAVDVEKRRPRQVIMDFIKNELEADAPKTPFLHQ